MIVLYIIKIKRKLTINSVCSKSNIKLIWLLLLFTIGIFYKFWFLPKLVEKAAPRYSPCSHNGDLNTKSQPFPFGSNAPSYQSPKYDNDNEGTTGHSIRLHDVIPPGKETNVRPGAPLVHQNNHHIQNTCDASILNLRRPPTGPYQGSNWRNHQLITQSLP